MAAGESTAASSYGIEVVLSNLATFIGIQKRKKKVTRILKKISIRTCLYLIERAVFLFLDKESLY